MEWKVQVADENGITQLIPVAWQPDATIEEARTWVDGGDLVRDAFKDWIRPDEQDGNGVYQLTIVANGEVLANTTETVKWDFNENQDRLAD